MKKNILKAIALTVALIFFSVQSAMAITWVTANQATIQWDAITADVDGDPFPAGTHVEYKVFLANKITDPDKTNPADVTPNSITATEFTITLGVKGQYVAGVKALHVEDNTSVVLAESDFAWSDNPADCADTDGDGVGNDFGIRFFAALPTTKLSPKPAP